LGQPTASAGDGRKAGTALRFEDNDEDEFEDDLGTGGRTAFQLNRAPTLRCLLPTREGTRGVAQVVVKARGFPGEVVEVGA
jgi:hypothetical protein